jgi:hypothetical protein
VTSRAPLGSPARHPGLALAALACLGLTLGAAFVPAVTFPGALVTALALAWYVVPPTAGWLASPRHQLSVLALSALVALAVTSLWTRAWTAPP